MRVSLLLVFLLVAAAGPALALWLGMPARRDRAERLEVLERHAAEVRERLAGGAPPEQGTIDAFARDLERRRDAVDALVRRLAPARLGPAPGTAELQELAARLDVDPLLLGPLGPGTPGDGPRRQALAAVLRALERAGGGQLESLRVAPPRLGDGDGVHPVETEARAVLPVDGAARWLAELLAGSGVDPPADLSRLRWERTAPDEWGILRSRFEEPPIRLSLVVDVLLVAAPTGFPDAAGTERAGSGSGPPPEGSR